MSYQVFISYKHSAPDGGITRDYMLAEKLHRMLTANGVRTFFSEKDLSTSTYIHEIFRALDEARILIVVGTRRDHVESRWVREEWSTFLNAMLGGRKPKGEIYTCLEGLIPDELPLELYGQQSYPFSQADRLVQRVKHNLGLSSGGDMVRFETPTESAQSETYPTFRKGEKVKFGHYPYRYDDSDVTSLQWRVLDVQNDRALLITDRIIDAHRYHDVFESVTWENCTLRAWLGGEFLQTAFSPEEQERILTVTNENPDNPIWFTQGGRPTRDKVFALSIDEALRYFEGNEDRVAKPTPFAVDRGVRVCVPGSGYWWLRSPGDKPFIGAYIMEYGTGVNIDDTIGVILDENIGVRPALWLQL